MCIRDRSKSSYFHDPEPNNENNNEYDDNIWEMEYDDDINNIDQEEESSPKNNSGGDDDEEHHIYDIDQKGEGLFASPIIDSDEKVFELGNLDDSINTEIILWVIPLTKLSFHLVIVMSPGTLYQRKF
ncbi:hypothetical protein GLOIN_2v1780396 [Rhizophagus irregularis DAOM 181602=DAOM 197198]|uniref:Uncharacterized protein n=1 Tax=Rhizophagus irregularis (strain DAOM 181602 / DAOM 197198 / MUCL 43194) TaxID=747089 RepID=A0A2P4PME1_RHIID|nr:hypothetical protein GLOIN_2v1780396 [Rhizophagus irregularis DAOM 181602=DAOM 197198]POG66558.1 hypothetical protein GLOIN_2v1780396 [Rhizophagus irregularis DAOM 181602=DAOM 197198]|eukprot:XP_025173424.1 hypothetical protein GLOIN_2v1780396 [Rhizophagus irregularis DAOM 181602=DAOM 197198]